MLVVRQGRAWTCVRGSLLFDVDTLSKGRETEPDSDSISKTWTVNDGRQVLDQRPVEEKERKMESYLGTTAKATLTSRRADSIMFHIYCMPTEGRFFHSIRHSLSFLTRLSVSVYLGPPSLLGIPKDEEISIILSESLRVEGSPNRRSSLLYSKYSRVKGISPFDSKCH